MENNNRNCKIYTDEKGEKHCRCFKRCGGCQLDEPYKEQLARKQAKAERLLSRYCKVEPIIGMKEPYNYRAKVQNVYALSRGRIISGVYQSSDRRMVTIEDCMLENKRAQRIVKAFKGIMKQLKLTPYDMLSGRGVVRHTLIRISETTGEIMLVIVTNGAMLPAKKNLVSALRRACPEITTVVQNICTDSLPLTLGSRSVTLYGKGCIEDELCGCRFILSPGSFYQVNPKQTEILYNTAVNAAGIEQGTKVIDAYCGTGTIGLICASRGAEVIGCELEPRAVKDAQRNAKLNGIESAKFFNADAGSFMTEAAKEGYQCGVLIMDPPRAGASREFITAAGVLSPERIVYVSCGIESLARDLSLFRKEGYRTRLIQPVDMFPHTMGIECCCLLEKKKDK